VSLKITLVSAFILEEEQVDGFARWLRSEQRANIFLQFDKLVEQSLSRLERKICMAEELTGLPLIGPAVLGAGIESCAQHDCYR
jgi:hypothetical protein